MNLLKSLKFLQYLFCVIIIFCAVNCYSQVLTWQKIFNGPSETTNDYGYASCRADGQNVYILGSISNQRIYLLKINQYGDTLWTRIIGNSFSRGIAIVESDSGSCLLTGDIENRQAFAIKVNKEGNIIWQKYYGGDYVQLNDIDIVENNCYLLCGRENFNYGTILKIDYYGNLIWKKLYSSVYTINFQSFCEFGDTGYLLTGWKVDNISEPAKGLIYKIDTAGNYIWDTTFRFSNYPISGRKIIKTNNGYFLSGNIHDNKIFFIRTNLNGSIAYTKIYDTLYNSYDIGGFKMINSNRYIMNFSQDSNSFPTFGKILILDTLANELRSKIYTSQRQVTFGTFTLLNDTGFMFTGTIDNNTSSGRDVYIIKSDTLLNAEPPIGINQTTISLPSNFLVNRNFPNPFNPKTTFRYELNKPGDIIIKIYDITGKIVFEKFINNVVVGKHNFTWYPTNLSSGVYFAKLSHNNNSNFTFKLMFLK